MKDPDELDKAADSLHAVHLQAPVIHFNWKDRLVLFLGCVAFTIAIYFFLRGF